jgi:hypothetical protein
MKKFAGLEKVSYSDTISGAETDIIGKVSVDSTIEPDNTKTETPHGSAYGGSMVTAEIYFLDDADYDTIEGFMTADTEKFWHFHFKDGTEYRTTVAINPFARRSPGVNARDGLVSWIMDFEHYGAIPLIEVA